MATINNINIYKGENASIVFTMNPVVDIAGWTITLTVRRHPTDPTILFTQSATLGSPTSAGQFSFSMTSTDTRTLGVGTFVYDVQRTNVGSEAVLSIGQMGVLQEVLYP